MYKKLRSNDLCWCGSGKKYKKCHEAFDERIIECEVAGHVVPDRGLLKTPEQIQGIRESAKINIACLDLVASKIQAGMSTEDIDRLVAEKTAEMGGICATMNYE